MLVRTVKVGGGFAVGDWSIRLLDVRALGQGCEARRREAGRPRGDAARLARGRELPVAAGGIDVRVWEIHNSGVKVGVGAPACVKIEVERPIDDEPSRVGCLG